MRDFPVVAAITVSVLVLFAWPAQAQNQPWQLRLGVVKVEPNVKSGEITDTGSSLAVGGATAPQLSLAYRLTPLWSLELAGTAAKHLLATEGGTVSGVDAGSVWMAPVMLSLQIHVYAGPRLDPYLGVGVVMATFHRHAMTPDLEALGLAQLTFQSSLRVGSQLGIDYRMGERWRANLDLRYAPITTKIGTALAGGGSLGEISLQVSPWIFGAGIGVCF